MKESEREGIRVNAVGFWMWKRKLSKKGGKSTLVE